jgi:hypothetical protein
MNNKNRLALCELHYTPIHGKTDESCPTIESHYLLIATFKPTEQNIVIQPNVDAEDSDSESSDSDDIDFDEQQNEMYHLQSVMRMYRRQYDMITRTLLIMNQPHKIIRNYKAIIAKPNYLQPEIVQCIVLMTRETVVVKKTFWIRLIQRTWKRVFRTRRSIAINLDFIINYQLHGGHSNKIPSIRGMLWYLRN